MSGIDYDSYDEIITRDNEVAETMNTQTILYFAYGMNLAPEYMQGAKMVGRARLHGWRLIVRGFADIEPGALDDYVEGGVWEIDAEMEKRLDRREGVFGRDYDMYERITVTADMPWDEVECLTYRMRAHTVAQMRNSWVSPSYIETIRDGRRFFGIEDIDRDLPCLPA